MVTLPGGFSPVRAIQQLGSIINPTGGVADYDVYSQFGDQRGGEVQGVSTSPYAGSTYYDTNTGRMMEWNGTAYQPASAGGSANATESSFTTGSGGTNYDPVAAQKAAQQNLYRQGLNTGIANLEGQLGVLDSQQAAQTQKLIGEYDKTKGRLGTDFTTGQQNLQRATDQVQGSKQRSLSNLRSWLQSQGMGYANQLGAMGAGNSSATGMINFALGQQGSRERGGILQDAGMQQQSIDLQGQQLQTDYTRSLEDLESWKADTLNDIGLQYTQARQQIQNSILDARARAAAEMELTQEAVNYLTQLEQQYRSNAETLAQQYQSFAPTQNINQGLLNFNASPVRQASLSGMNMPTPVNPEAQLTALLRRRDEEQLANPLGV